MDMHSQYLIDCALELGQITALEHSCLFHVQACGQQVERFGERAEHIEDFLHNTAQAFLATCDEPVRNMLSLLSGPILEAGLRALLERMEHEVQVRAQHDLGVSDDALGTLRRMLQGPAQESSEPVFTCVEDIRFEVVHRYVASRFASRIAQWQSDKELYQRSVQWYQELTHEQRQHVRSALRRVMSPAGSQLADSEQGISVRELTTGVPRKDTASSRSAIKKAFKLFDRLGKSQDVRMLVHGHEVTLSHSASPFKFVLKAHCGDWLHRRTDNPGHGAPFSVHLLTKEDVHIAQLCVYLDNTPVLDQLLAMTLFVESGQEKILLEKANWFGISDDVEDVLLAGSSEQGKLEGKRRKVVGILLDKAPEFLPRIGYCEDGKPLPSQKRTELRFAGRFFEEQEHWLPYKGPVKTWLLALLAQNGLEFREQLPQVPPTQDFPALAA